jgi:hypothetical protein
LETIVSRASANVFQFFFLIARAIVNCQAHTSLQTIVQFSITILQFISVIFKSANKLRSTTGQMPALFIYVAVTERKEWTQI